MSLSKISRLGEFEFQQQVERAVARVADLLQNERQSVKSILDTVGAAPHTYDDKFGVATFLGKSTVQALCHCLQQLQHSTNVVTNVGDTVDLRMLAAKLGNHQRATLRFRLDKKGSFMRTDQRQVESPTVVTSITNRTNANGTKTSSSETTQKAVTTVTEHVWKVEAHWVVEIVLHECISGHKRTHSSQPDDQLITSVVSDVATKKAKIDGSLVTPSPNDRDNSGDTVDASMGVAPTSQMPQPDESTSSWSASGSSDCNSGSALYSRGASVTTLGEHRLSFDVLSTSKDVAPAEVPTSNPITKEILISDLLRFIGAGFQINRDSAACRTPRRNPEIECLLHQVELLHTFTNDVCMLLQHHVQRNVTTDFSSCHTAAMQVFVPCLPYLLAQSQRKPPQQKSDDAAKMVSVSNPVATLPTIDEGDVPHADEFSAMDDPALLKLAQEHASSLRDALTKCMSNVEKRTWMVLMHMQQLLELFAKSVDMIEQRLRQQLMDAVSNELTPSDFTRFMNFHYSRLLRPAYRPRLFSFDVRRPGQSPEGTISLVTTSASHISLVNTPVRHVYCGQRYTRYGMCKCGSCDGCCGPNSGCQCPSCEHIQQISTARTEEIRTLQRHFTATDAAPMRFAIRAGTNVVFKGERFFHSWMRSQFADSATDNLSLQIHARQFSCFLVLIGNVTAASVFEPKHAFVVRNKDEFLVPLVLHQRVSASEFQDLLQGLSPEQQHVAKLLREIQLSSLFGICILQIKPQLERVLNLPDGSLVKETELTQALLQLFIKYQVPSAQLEVAREDHDAPVAEKLSKVREYVKNVEKMIHGEGEKVIAQRKQEHRADSSSSSSNDGSEEEEEEEDDCEEECMFKSVTEKKVVKKSKSVVKPAAAAAAMSSGSRGGFGGATLGRSVSVFGSAVFGAAPPAPGAGFSFGGASFSSNGAHQLESMSVPILSTTAVIANSKQNLSHEALEFNSDDELDSEQEEEDALVVTANPTSMSDTTSSSFSAADTAKGKTTSSPVAVRWAQFPEELEKLCAARSAETAALCPTRVEVGPMWTQSHAKHILASSVREAFGEEKQRVAKREAFDLIDALSRTGALSFDDAQLHIFMVTTQNFARTLVDTCIVENVNPIVQVERAMVLLSTTIHGGVSATQVVKPHHAPRFASLTTSGTVAAQV